MAVLSDGPFVVGGSETTGSDEDFVAFKLDPSDGSILWKWKVSIPSVARRIAVSRLPYPCASSLVLFEDMIPLGFTQHFKIPSIVVMES